MRKMKALMLKTKRKSNRAIRLAVALSLGISPTVPVGMTALSCLTAARPARAATKVTERVADGQVVTKSDTPISGAVVFLRDSHSQAIRTYICDQQGHFHFGQLAQNTDYELWAESNGVRSHSKSISSFDSKNDYIFTLKINTGQ